jgi:hypothetical protein
MRTIEKKIDIEWFDKILAGEKTCEIRLADFEASEGDILVLKEHDKNRKLTGRQKSFKITYCANTKGMEQCHSKEEIEKHGLWIMSIKPL